MVERTVPAKRFRFRVKPSGFRYPRQWVVLLLAVVAAGAVFVAPVGTAEAAPAATGETPTVAVSSRLGSMLQVLGCDEKCERGKGIADSDFLPLITCNRHKTDMRWRALNCPFPVSSYRLLSQSGVHEVLEKSNVAVTSSMWSLYKAQVESTFDLMWVAVTMPWMEWFIDISDIVSSAVLRTLNGGKPTPELVGNTWWTALLAVIVLVAAWKTINPRRVFRERGNYDPGSGLKDALMFLLWAAIWISLLFFFATWHGPNPYDPTNHVAEQKCEDHLTAPVDGCVNGFTRLALKPVSLIMEFASSFDVFGRVLDDAFTPVELGPAATDTQRDDLKAGVWAPYVRENIRQGDEVLAALINKDEKKGAVSGGEIYGIEPFAVELTKEHGCTTSQNLSDASLEEWTLHCQKDLSEEHPDLFVCERNLVGTAVSAVTGWMEFIAHAMGMPLYPHVGNPFDCSGTTEGQVGSANYAMPDCVPMGNSEWDCAWDVSELDNDFDVDCDPYEVSTGNAQTNVARRWACVVAEEDQAAMEQDTRDRNQAAVSRRRQVVQEIEDVGAVEVEHVIPCPSKEELQASGRYQDAGVRIRADVRERRAAQENQVLQIHVLACRMLQPWKKQLLHDPWETLHFGEPVEPDLTSIVKGDQVGRPNNDRYPDALLTNGESVALLLWATTPGSGSKVDTDLLHNLQVDQALVDPLTEGQHSQGAIVAAGIALFFASLAALGMLAMMMYASLHMLIVIGLLPAALALAPFPKLRRVTIRTVLSFIRSTLLVSGLMLMLYLMSASTHLLSSLVRDIPGVLAAFFLVFGHGAVLYFGPWKLFRWSQETNRRIKAKLDNPATWKGLRSAEGWKNFGKDIGKEAKAAGMSTFKSGRAAQIRGTDKTQQGTKGKGADKKQTTSVSGKTSGMAKRFADAGKTIASTRTAEGAAATVAKPPEKPPGKPAEPVGKAPEKPPGKPAEPVGKAPEKPPGKPAEPDAKAPEKPPGKPAEPAAKPASEPEEPPTVTEESDGAPAEQPPLSEPVPSETPSVQAVDDEETETSAAQDALTGLGSPDKEQKRFGKAVGRGARTAGRIAGERLRQTETGKKIAKLGETKHAAADALRGAMDVYQEEGFEGIVDVARGGPRRLDERNQQALKNVEGRKANPSSLVGYLTNKQRDEHAENQRSASIGNQLAALDKAHKETLKPFAKEEKERAARQRQRDERSKYRQEIAKLGIEGLDEKARLKTESRSDRRELGRDERAAAAADQQKQILVGEYQKEKKRLEKAKAQEIWVESNRSWARGVRTAAAKKLLRIDPDKIDSSVLRQVTGDPQAMKRLRDYVGRLNEQQRQQVDPKWAKHLR